MIVSRNTGPTVLVTGLALALLFYRMQSARWAQFAPSWHGLIRDGYFTIAALFVALAGLFLTLRR